MRTCAQSIYSKVVHIYIYFGKSFDVKNRRKTRAIVRSHRQCVRCFETELRRRTYTQKHIQSIQNYGPGGAAVLRASARSAWKSEEKIEGRNGTAFDRMSHIVRVFFVCIYLDMYRYASTHSWDLWGWSLIIEGETDSTHDVSHPIWCTLCSISLLELFWKIVKYRSRFFS